MGFHLEAPVGYGYGQGKRVGQLGLGSVFQA